MKEIVNMKETLDHIAKKYLDLKEKIFVLLKDELKNEEHEHVTVTILTTLFSNLLMLHILHLMEENVLGESGLNLILDGIKEMVLTKE